MTGDDHETAFPTRTSATSPSMLRGMLAADARRRWSALNRSRPRNGCHRASGSTGRGGRARARAPRRTADPGAPWPISGCSASRPAARCVPTLVHSTVIAGARRSERLGGADQRAALAARPISSGALPATTALRAPRRCVDHRSGCGHSTVTTVGTSAARRFRADADLADVIVVAGDRPVDGQVDGLRASR